MYISANAFIFNEFGDTLLVRRDDTRSLAPPGGAMTLGELPTDTIVRKVREETGLEVMPVRLVGLSYLPTRPHDYLFLSFRAIQRGGTLKTSGETPQVGFVESFPLPDGMLDIHRQQTEQALAHQGGPPVWQTYEMSPLLTTGNLLLNKVVYPLLQLQRRIKGATLYEPPPDWQIFGRVIIRDEQGRVLWTLSAQKNAWTLPTAVAEAEETPWSAAARAARACGLTSVQLADLSGIYPAGEKATMTFVFTTKATAVAEAALDGSFFGPGDEPPSADPVHLRQLQDADDNRQQTQFRIL